MRVIKPSRIREYIKQFPETETFLKGWLRLAAKTTWANLIEVRKSFPHADKAVVASKNIVTVFNVCGNKYRLITAIHYDTGFVYVLLFMTHAQYSKNHWKGQL